MTRVTTTPVTPTSLLVNAGAAATLFAGAGLLFKSAVSDALVANLVVGFTLGCGTKLLICHALAGSLRRSAWLGAASAFTGSFLLCCLCWFQAQVVSALWRGTPYMLALSAAVKSASWLLAFPGYFVLFACIAWVVPVFLLLSNRSRDSWPLRIAIVTASSMACFALARSIAALEFAAGATLQGLALGLGLLAGVAIESAAQVPGEQADLVRPEKS